jgi:CubicO group peptidase (beta-lactamase class C family)
VAVALGDRPVERLSVGQDAAGRPVGPGGLSAVASITKLATALVVLRLVERGVLELDQPLAEELPEAVAAQPGVTIRTLLSHTSGMPWKMEAAHAEGGDRLSATDLEELALATSLERPPLTKVQYSNPAYALLGIVVERRTARPFREVLAQLVLDPLGIEAYLGDEPPRPTLRLADVRAPGSGTEREWFNTPAWRSLGLPWAGLVTSVDGALGLVQAFCHGPRGLLGPALRAEAIRNQAIDPASGQTLSGGQVVPLIWPKCPWGLGPELRNDKRPHWAAAEASPDSFGHAGASGCLAWADPEVGVAWAIVGTRTAHNGWLVRHGPAIGAAILAYAAQR